MKISQLIPCALIAAICAGSLTLNSCGGANSSASSSKDSPNLLEPYTVTAMLEGEESEFTDDGSYPEFDMVPTTESEGNFTTTLILDDAVITSSTFKWITLPSADTPHAELEMIEEYSNSDKQQGSRRLHFTLTFTDPRSATATLVIKIVEPDREDTFHDVKVLFSAPMY